MKTMLAATQSGIERERGEMKRSEGTRQCASTLDKPSNRYVVTRSIPIDNGKVGWRATRIIHPHLQSTIGVA